MGLPVPRPRQARRHDRLLPLAYLSPTRNTKAAERFLGKALKGLKDWEKPRVIDTDKAPTYAAALAELRRDGKCPHDLQHRQVKDLNNVV